MRVLTYCILIILFAYFCIFPKDSHSENQDVNFALLIGVNTYPDLSRKYQLKGCVNDVELIENLLIRTFRFKPENVRKLTNEKATKKSILESIEKFLILNAKKNSQIVIYFSGHGGQMTDLHGDESDGLDETILPYDAHRDETKEYKDISDDELGDLLKKLSQKSDNITVILDSCHSGSGTRATDIPKQVDEIFRINSSKFKLSSNQINRSVGFLPSNDSCVVISASKDDELAYETREWLKPYGSLTLALNEVMQVYPNATYREIMYKVTEKVSSRNHEQHPQLEGKRRDAPIFGNLGIIENFIEIESVSSGSVTLKAGMVHNITVGSVYDIYKLGTTSTDQKENFLGKIRIIKTDKFTSDGLIEEGKGKIVKNSACFEISHNYGTLQLNILLDLNNAPNIENQIRSVLKKHNMVRLVSKSDDFDLNIRLEKDSVILEKPDGYVLTKIGNNKTDIESKLPEVLKKYARYQNIFKLRNSNKNWIKLNIKRWEHLDQNGNPENELKLCEIKGHRLLNAEDIITLSIKNNFTAPLYVYLFDLGTDGSVTLIYPPEGDQNSPLLSGISISTVPMEILPPKGLNALKVIATTVPTDFRVLTQSGIKDAIAEESPLGQLLDMALNGIKTGKSKGTEIKDWSTEMISFFIETIPTVKGKEQ